MTEAALEKVDTTAYPILAGGDAQDAIAAIQENFAGEQVTPFDLEQVRVPAAGGTVFSLPDIAAEGGEALEKKWRGIILYQRLTRAYYATAFEESEGGPPQCMSLDSVTGHGDPGGDCSECPLSKFPEEGGGTPCSQRRQLFILREGSLLPTVFPIPPTSLRRTRQQFFLPLTSKGMPYYGVEVELSLEKGKSKQRNMDVALVNIRVVRPLSADEVENVRAYRKALLPALQVG